MNIFKDRLERNKFYKYVLLVIVALALIQIARALIMVSFFYLLQPGTNINLFQIINGFSFIIVGLALLLIFKPSLKELGVDWNDISLKNRIFYLLGGGLLLVMIIIPYFLAWEASILILGIVFGIFVPAFEELLFRGYIWGKIESSAKMYRSQMVTLFTVTILFIIWHLGYMDVFLLHPLGMGNLLILMLSKLGIGLVLGLIVGYMRLKTGKTYLSFLFHGFWNVFAP
jgi:membrane protease YdiL (CAAX protease family)